MWVSGRRKLDEGEVEHKDGSGDDGEGQGRTPGRPRNSLIGPASNATSIQSRLPLQPLWVAPDPAIYAEFIRSNPCMTLSISHLAYHTAAISSGPFYGP